MLSINFLTISDEGRLLFPREWGREHFYTSLSRERYEGNGGLQAYTLKYDFKTKALGLTGGLGAGIVNSPSKDAFQLKKYGVPSYYHFQGLLDYRFENKLKGLDLKMLVVNKAAKNESQLEDIYRINRVNMWNLNMVLDYRF